MKANTRFSEESLHTKKLNKNGYKEQKEIIGGSKRNGLNQVINNEVENIN